MFWIYLLLIINLFCNVTVIAYVDAQSITATLKYAPWHFKIPHAIWYWLVLLYHYKILPYIIRIIICGLLSLITLSLCLYIPVNSLEQFLVLFGMCFIISALIISYAITWVYKLVECLYRRKKRKETSDNNKA